MKKEYTFEEILQLSLPARYCIPIIEKIKKMLGMPGHWGLGLELWGVGMESITSLSGDEDASKFFRSFVTALARLSFKDTPEYLLADTKRERAMIAWSCGRPSKAIEKIIFDVWQEETDKMSDVEKALGGWA